MSDFQGIGPPPPPAQTGYGGLGGLGLVFAIAGAGLNAVGGYFNAETQRNELRQRAGSIAYDADVARIGAYLTEDDAQQIMAAGRDEAARTSLRYGAIAGEQRAAQGASGTEVGVGSNAETIASTNLAKEVDMLAIHRNTVRAVGQTRMRAAELQGRAVLADASAENLRRTARSINPILGGITSLVGSAGPVLGAAGQYTSGRY